MLRRFVPRAILKEILRVEYYVFLQMDIEIPFKHRHLLLFNIEVPYVKTVVAQRRSLYL